MSFKITSILYSFINLILALFFVFLGIVSFLLPWFPGVRMSLATFIMEDSIMIFLFGFCFLVIAIAFIVNVIWNSRHQYYRLKGGADAVSISESIFQDYLNNYWKKLFPYHEIPSSVRLHKNQVRIEADLPFVPLDKQKELLQKMERDITEIFTKLLGYRTKYLFAVSFESAERV